MEKEKLSLGLNRQERLAIIDRLIKRGFKVKVVRNIFGIGSSRAYVLLEDIEKGKLKTKTEMNQTIATKGYIESLVLIRDGQQCQVCLKEGTEVYNTNKDDSSHHYKIFDTADMITVCSKCLSKILINKERK